jgi:hypothetical protein
MNSKKIMLSLIPWLAFSLLAEFHESHAAGIAAAASAVIAAGIAIANRGSAGFKIIDVAGIVCFTGLAIVAFAADATVNKHIVDYGRGGTTILLGAIMLGSLLVTPFTAQYAREVVPAAYWKSPVFRSVNEKLSVAWGLVALISGIGHTYAGYRLSHNDLPVGLRLLLNWGVPVVLGLRALAYTRKITSDDQGTNRATTTA